ncbi:MAG: hypothetical protein LBE33_01980 [Zoogloeaceae bacterium]|nr:hypothetical protein [Zoogloeaceae bacterium]
MRAPDVVRRFSDHFFSGAERPGAVCGCAGWPGTAPAGVLFFGWITARTRLSCPGAPPLVTE